ncbi:MAG: hypothetical protein IJW32_02495 [Clostridia bacterium]|nr:hypothetical protein [Clostridia bacterium]
MWEYCIIFEDDLSADYFKNKIYKTIKNYNGIITKLVDNNYIKILIAVPIIERFKIHNIIREKIAETILVNYKKEYILSKLNFDITKAIDMQIFLKALVVFDSETDKAIIYERLKFDSNLIVNSFINFKLSFLKRKWEELINLANDNSFYLLNKDSFLELIKFLISNLDYRYYAINIFTKKDCYLLCDIEGQTITDYLVGNGVIYDEKALLTSLIALNPEKIIIHNNILINDKLIKLLYDLFSNRIEISK